jgi:hypothetical protein
VYTATKSSSVLALEAQVAPQLLLLRHFAAATALRTFIGEWALDNLGESLSLETISRWWYDEAGKTPHGIGLAIWNFDGPGGWGAVVPNGQPPRVFWGGVNRDSAGPSFADAM